MTLSFVGITDQDVLRVAKIIQKHNRRLPYSLEQIIDMIESLVYQTWRENTYASTGGVVVSFYKTHSGATEGRLSIAPFILEDQP